MSADVPILVELPEALDRVPAEEIVPLRLVLRRPADQSGSVTIQPINCKDGCPISLDTDSFQDDITLQPGESYALTFGVCFNRPGTVNLSDFRLPVNSEADGGSTVPLPDRDVRVVPSLARMPITVERVRACRQGVKLEVCIKNTGDVSWEDFEVAIGPTGNGRAGVTYHRRPIFSPGDKEENIERLEVVLAGDTVELTLAGTADGTRVEHHRSLPIPTEDATRIKFPPYAFLEPRALTTDRITVEPADGGPEVQARQGIFPISGAGQQYLVTITPSDSRAKDVNLLRSPGQAEVEPLKPQGPQAWSFLLTVVDNPSLTQLVRLYYDVKIPGRDLRGELYLSVHPTNAKLWTIAATAGAAITIKGFTDLVPAFLNLESLGNEWLASIFELMQKQWTDWLLLLSIPLLRVGLGLLDRCVRSFRGV